MKYISILCVGMILVGCSASNEDPYLSIDRYPNLNYSIEEHVLVSRAALLMAGLAYDDACNGNRLDSHADLKNPDNVRIAKNRKLLMSRLQPLFQKRYPHMPADKVQLGLYMTAANSFEESKNLIISDGCDSKNANKAKANFFLFSKSEPEAVNIATDEYIIKQGGVVTISKKKK